MMQNRKFMPELPEVETVRSILEPILVGRTILKIDILKDRIIQTDIDEFKTKLVGSTYEKIERIGKYLLFKFSNDLVIVSHLRMEGKYIEILPGQDLSPFARVVFYLDDGRRLCYDDSRQFGTMELSTKGNYLSLPSLRKLGKEPFDADPKVVHDKFKKTTRPIKEALLDQTIMTGLGNIYVDEALFRVKLHPLVPANKVSLEKTKALILASIDVLNDALIAGGSTIRSYHPGNGITGDFQSQLHAYGREGLACHTCGTKMKKIFVGGRGTTFCPLCQRNPYKALAVAITGLIGAGKSTVGQYLRDKGYIVYDADKIVRDFYKDSNVTLTLEKILGSGISLHEKGKFSKTKLRELLLKDPSAKKKLEAFIHPLVKEKIIELVESAKEKVVFFEVPLVFSHKIDELFPYIVGVETDLASQRKFLEIRGTRVILRPDAMYLKNRSRLSYIIINNSTLDNLYRQVDVFLSKNQL